MPLAQKAEVDTSLQAHYVLFSWLE